MGFAERRLQLIRSELQREQKVNVNELARRLSISTETIRRDLKELEARGEARRVYGGAVVDSLEGDRPFGERLRIAAREKARIGELAAGLVEDGMTLFIDTGTTTLAFARQIVGRKISVVTNSIDIAAALCEDPAADVRVLGGKLSAGYKAVFGHETVTSLRQIFVDAAIMGIGTVHASHGFMDRGEDEAVLRRVARDQAKRSVMLADSSKFGRLGSIRTFGLGDIDTLVSDAAPSAEFAELFRQHDVDMIHA